MRYLKNHRPLSPPGFTHSSPLVFKSAQIGPQGFTLVELLIVMSIFVVVIAIGSNTFTLLLKQSTQQNKQTESQIERIAGLEMMRSDIASAGFGLPWAFQSTFSY